MRYDGRHVYGVLVLYAEKEMLLCHPTKPEYANVSVRVVVNESRGAKKEASLLFLPVYSKERSFAALHTADRTCGRNLNF